MIRSFILFLRIHDLALPLFRDMHATLRYLSAAANRFSHVACVSHDGLMIAFGSHKFVAIWTLRGTRSLAIDHAVYPIVFARKMAQE
jgi:hypothetical protein